MTIEHLNPETLHVNPAFSQGTIASAGRTLYVGGQNGTDGEGDISGRRRRAERAGHEERAWPFWMRRAPRPRTSPS